MDKGVYSDSLCHTAVYIKVFLSFSLFILLFSFFSLLKFVLFGVCLQGWRADAKGREMNGIKRDA